MTLMVADIEYYKPDKAGEKAFLGLAKYFQYRNDRSGHIPQEKGLERWVDGGFGDNFRSVSRGVEQCASTRVLAWTLVLSPSAMVWEQVDEGRRREFMREVTVRFMEQFFARRGFLVPPEYSFVVHDKNTALGEPQVHSHVVIAGTSASGFERVSVEMNHGQMHELHEIANQVVEHELELYQEQQQALEVERDPAAAERGGRDVRGDRAVLPPVALELEASREN